MKEDFLTRHIGSDEAQIQEMLNKINVSTLDKLINQTVPKEIRLSRELNIPDAISEQEYLKELKIIASKNKVFKSLIGLGYYNSFTPSVIQRNILENPGWYTSYTPYQAEISQGRLEALLNFQTMVSDLTALPIANASLLDEGTAAAEAMLMFWNNRTKTQIQSKASKFYVSSFCFPQTISVLLTRSEPLGIEIVISEALNFEFDESFFGALIQYPDLNGQINDFSSFVEKAKNKDVQICVATDLMALSLLSPPGEWGADCAIGNSQRFGVPLGFGGPHAAFFACTENYKRIIPGRIIGISKDINGDIAYRMALQTREQHIKRDKATSNICTAQALLAIMASMYAVYHGPKRIKDIAQKIHDTTFYIYVKLKNAGYKVLPDLFFDTLVIETPHAVTIENLALKNELNLRLIDINHISLSIDETCCTEDIVNLLYAFSLIAGKEVKSDAINESKMIQNSKSVRNSDFLVHKTFNSYHSETEFIRYIKRLENKDISLVNSMIPLGANSSYIDHLIPV